MSQSHRGILSDAMQTFASGNTDRQIAKSGETAIGTPDDSGYAVSAASGVLSRFDHVQRLAGYR